MKNAVRRQAGFSIVELLVAMALSLMLLTGVYAVFLGNTQTYRINENQARIQENGRFALDFLTREIRTAGYFGCVVNNVFSTLNSPTAFLYNFNREIEGYEWDDATTDWIQSGVSGVDASLNTGTNDPLAGSDIVTLRRIDPNAALRINADMTINNDAIGLTPAPAVGEILMINDCQEAWVFAVTGLSGGKATHIVVAPPALGNSTDAFTYGFAAGTDVYRPETVTYYISNDDNGQPALFRKVGTAVAEEILQGIANIQVSYGEDTDGDGDVEDYRTADNVAAWNAVLSVRIGFLVQTPEEIAGVDPDTNTYNVNGETIDPINDRRQRRVFTTTIGLRNKLL